MAFQNPTSLVSDPDGVSPNVLQPAADVPALIIKKFSNSQSSAAIKLQDASGNQTGVIDFSGAGVGSTVQLAPDDSADNVIQPSSDASALSILAFASQTEPTTQTGLGLVNIKDSGGELVLRVVVPGNYAAADGQSAVRLEMPSTGTDPVAGPNFGLPWGPIGIMFGGQAWQTAPNQRPDPVLFMGYNRKNFQYVVVEAGARGGGFAGFGVEGNAIWDDGIGRHEVYIELGNQPTSGSVPSIGFRPFFTNMITTAGGLPSSRYGETIVTGNPVRLGVPDDNAQFTPGSNASRSVMVVNPGAPAAALTVTGATNATPIVITTSAAHGLVNGQLVRITGVGGNTAANGGWRVTVVTATTFSLNTSVGNGAYTSGGTVTPYAIDQVQVAGQAVYTSTNETSPGAIYTSNVTLTSAIALWQNNSVTRTYIHGDGRLVNLNNWIEVDRPNDDTAFLARFNSDNGWYVSTTGNMTFGRGTSAATATISVLYTGGLKIGAATTEKLAFWDKTPNVQPTTGIAAAAFVANTSGTINDSATFGGYTIGQIAAALIRVGILA